MPDANRAFKPLGPVPEAQAVVAVAARGRTWALAAVVVVGAAAAPMATVAMMLR
jgi:hypothetical protein